MQLSDYTTGQYIIADTICILYFLIDEITRQPKCHIAKFQYASNEYCNVFLEFSVDRCAPSGSPDDLQLAAFSRTCYEFGVGRGGSFEEARGKCKAHGGDLVHSLSPASTSFILAELERRKLQLKTQLVWIGAQKEPGVTSRTWRWVNGKKIF